METPNTRYRRKREDDTIGNSNGNGTPRSGSASGSQDQDRVVWVHDQRLKRAVQMASEHGMFFFLHFVSITIRRDTDNTVELAPPTPTQKPRSICSSRPSDTSRPRKRPCRKSRSAPTPLSSAGIGGSAQSTGDVGLEMLLQRFELFNSTSSSLGSSTSTPGKGKGKELGSDRGVSSPITRSATTARVNQNNSTSLIQSENQRNTILNKDMFVQAKPIAPSPLSNRTNITSNPTNTINTGTTTNTKPITRPQQPRALAGKPKPFKTPFLNPPAIRSSPRRTVPPSPLRALPIQTPTRAKVQIHNANVDIGEDEPEGNDSFDSFDGLFEEGGPDIDELFRAVDGSRGVQGVK